MDSQIRNLFADMDDMPGLESSLGEIVDSGKIPEVLPMNQVDKNDEQETETTEQEKEGQEDKENEIQTENGNLDTKEDAFKDDVKEQNSPGDTNNDVTKEGELERRNSSGTEGEGKRKDREKKQGEVHDIRRSSRHDKDLLKKYTASSKISKQTTELNSSNILPNLRRSNRANKGVSKEMFDPSHVPSPKYRKTTNVRENSNSNDSDGSYKKLQPQKEGEEEEGEEEEEEQDEEKKVQEEDDVKPVEEQKQEQISESESDSDDDDYNDPNRLWCICKKPHNGRFMISCDNCEEWYHGDCVGITVQRGRQMERRGEEYVCPRCLKQQNKKKNEKMGVSLKGYAHDKKDEMEKRRKNSEEGNKKRRKSSDGVSKLPKKLRKCIVSTCNNRAQADSVYCSNVCILRHAKESLVVVTKAKRDSITKPSVGDKQESREERITRKIREALAKGKVAVVCRKTSKIFSNASAPLKADLSVFLRQNPSFQVLKVPKKSRYAEEGLKRKSSSQNVEERKNTNPYDMDPDYKPKDLLEHKPSNPYKQHRLPSGGEIEKARKHKLEREESTEAKKSKHKKVMDQERRNSSDRHPQKIPPHKRDSRSLSDDRNETKRESPSKKDGEVRKSVHKSLMNILQNRSNNSEDLKMHPSSITKLVMKIEESLYKLFGGVTSKYKNRYRSIMFNLKDEKNQGLWRKVILGEVTSSSLVKMTAEEMASKELAQWRKHELTQELEMIHELETSKNNARPVAKITHKGEIVINEDFSDLTESHLDTSNEKSAPTMAPHRVRRISANQPDSVSDTSLLAVDTTTQHSNHLFDMNCRICTGQVKEEDAAMEESSHKKVKRHTSIILSNEAQVSTETEQTDEELIQKISSYNIKPENPILSPSKSTLTKKDSTDDSELEAGTPEEDKSVLDEEKPESEKETDDKIYNATKPTAVTPSKLNRDHFLWTGVISMPELASFHTNAYSVSGNTKDLSNLIPLKLVLDGRIHPKVVWDYLAKVSSFPNKEVCVVQFRASSEDDRVGYVSMLSYFSSRRRFGVVSNQNTQVIKDIYLVPLLETEKVPNQLLPFKGPGIPDDHPSMLLGVIVRCLATQKKNTPDIPQSVPIKTEPKGKKPRTPDLSETKKSLLDRNRLLAPTMPHFTEKIKNSPGKVEDPAEEEEYNPETADFEVLGEEDLPEESPKHVLPKSEDDDEAYDPEKLTFEDDDDDVPYDPEVEAERLENTELKALQDKQAYLEQMKQQLEMKKAELAKEELTLQKHQPISIVPPPPPPVATPSPVDPRMAARMHSRNKGAAAVNKESPLQKIFSALNMERKPSS